jgi:putative ABC transport system substrate-binding protein
VEREVQGVQIFGSETVDAHSRSTNTTPVTVAVQQETRTIPIVFVNVSDPVASGIISRIDRPSGNITGFANLDASLGGKYSELLSQIMPGLKRVAIMSPIQIRSATRQHRRHGGVSGGGKGRGQGL